MRRNKTLKEIAAQIELICRCMEKEIREIDKEESLVKLLCYIHILRVMFNKILNSFDSSKRVELENKIDRLYSKMLKRYRLDS